MHSGLLQDLNLLFSSRRTRQLEATHHIPEVVWWILLFGGILTIAFTYLFGAHNFKMHMAITAGVAGSLALVVVLVVAFDYPFRGGVTVSSEPYQVVLDRMTNYTFKPK